MTNNEGMASVQAAQKIIKSNIGPNGLNNLAGYRLHRIISILGDELDRVQKGLTETAKGFDKDLAPYEREKLEQELLTKVGKEEFAIKELPKVPAAGIPWAFVDHDAAQILLKYGFIDGEVTA